MKGSAVKKAEMEGSYSTGSRKAYRYGSVNKILNLLGFPQVRQSTDVESVMLCIHVAPRKQSVPLLRTCRFSSSSPFQASANFCNERCNNIGTQSYREF